MTRTRLTRCSRQGRSAEPLSQCVEHRRVDFITTITDVWSDHRAHPLPRCRRSSQSLDTCFDNSLREPSPSGVDSSNGLARFAASENRNTVCGHNRYGLSRPSADDRVRLDIDVRRSRFSIRAEDPRSVNLDRQQGTDRNRARAGSKPVGCTSFFDQRMTNAADGHQLSSRPAPKAPRSDSSTARSSGSGASKPSRSPVVGCEKASRAACRAGRSSSKRKPRPLLLPRWRP